jgi:tetratricopeptide (TPR) repeat protein
MSVHLQDEIRELQIQLQTDPHNPNLLFQFAKIFLKYGDTGTEFIGTAIHCLELAYKLSQDDASIIFELSNAYLENNQFNKAEDLLKLFLDRNPQSAHANALLGSIYLSTGNLDFAKLHLKKANELSSYQNINYLRNYIATEQLNTEELEFNLKQLLILLKNPKLSTKHKGELHYLIADIFNKNVNYQKAVEHWISGAKFMKKNFENLHIETIFKYLKSALKNFSNENLILLKQLQKNLETKIVQNDEAETQVIFIVGLPRTGSTLIEQMLLTQMFTTSVGESNYFAKALVNEFKQDLTEIFANLNTLTDLKIENIKKTYLTLCQTDSQIIIDKTLSNFMYIPIIKTVLPNAKIIVTERNWEETRFSCFTQCFTDEQVAFSYSFDDLDKYKNLYEDILLKFEPHIEFFRIAYEDLVCEAELNTQKIFEFLNWNWNHDILNFHKSQKPVRTASITQVKKPLYKSSLKKWPRYKPFF